MNGLFLKNLLNNSRFYVLLLSVLLSIFVACWLRLQVDGDELYYIRTEQIFGFLSVGFLYVTLIISPLKKIMGSPEWMKNLVFARRALGVSVLYFALLHTGVSLWGQIGGFAGLALLPERFIWPIVLGLIAAVILVVMTLTSLDKMVVLFTFPRWKWLQRSVYICGLLIIVHVWAIGAHFIVSGVVEKTTFVALIILFGLESWRMGAFMAERYRWQSLGKYLAFGVFLCMWLGIFLGLVAFSRPVGAHMFSQDSATESGAVLHITPDDDPIAGQNSTFIFDIENLPPSRPGFSATLTVVDDLNRTATVPAQRQGHMVKADYTFPRQGLYNITLTIEQNGQLTHTFSQSQRVSRGALINESASSKPLWAGVGALASGMAAAVVAVIAIYRRKAISEYSKLP